MAVFSTLFILDNSNISNIKS